MHRGWVFLMALLFLPSAAAAGQFFPTIYNDGYSCPGGCDAHVVFRPEYNGTKYASVPTSPRSKPKSCVKGELCRVCFTDKDDSCAGAIYRGAGPDKWRFDFTTAFYEENCNKAGLPKALADKCKSFDDAYEKRIKGKVYCLADPDQEGCAPILTKATSAKEADQPYWDECRKIGAAKFNQKHAKKRQRSSDCAYEKHGTGGPNSKGQYWSRLLPAACPANSFVGRDGTDCCAKQDIYLGGFGRECTIFLVAKKE